MPQIIGCPDPQALKAFALGEGPSAWEDLAEHIEACAKCLAALKTLSAEDTLVDAVRAPETAPNVDQEFVRRLVGKVRSLLPASGRRAEQCAATPASGAGDETLAHEAESIEDVAGADGFAPPQEPDEIGRLAGYRVLKLLGVGGMGKVYMAEDAQLRRRVALKVMSATLARNPKARRRFVQEARLAAAIDHDHIVHIYQVGEDRGVPFLAMQLLSGVSLEDLLKRQGGLKVKQILRISAQVAEGLAAAHERDLIHRDIKPANIWIEPTGGGRAKILDFGLARNTAEDISLTQTGAIMGTPAYMAPEQARGEKVDHRCDLYSLGCVMYRMATGDLPIKGNDTMAMLMALVLHEPTPPVQLREDVPQALSDLIMALLAKEKEKRPASAKELVNALKNIERSLAGVVPGLASLGIAMTFIIGAPGTMHVIWELYFHRFHGFSPVQVALVAICGFLGFLMIGTALVFGFVFGVGAILAARRHNRSAALGVAGALLNGFAVLLWIFIAILWVFAVASSS